MSVNKRIVDLLRDYDDKVNHEIKRINGVDTRDDNNFGKSFHHADERYEKDSNYEDD